MTRELEGNALVAINEHDADRDIRIASIGILHGLRMARDLPLTYSADSEAESGTAAHLRTNIQLLMDRMEPK